MKSVKDYVSKKDVQRRVDKEELLGDLLKVARVRNSPEEMYEFIKERVVEAGKRDIVRKGSEVFSKDLVVVTDRNKVSGFYVNLETVKFLPPEVQAFFFLMMDALGCEYLSK
jgi:hypothetical protein